MEARAQNATPVLATIGVDIGKDVFHIVGFDSDGKIALRRKIKRLALADTFKKLPVRPAGCLRSAAPDRRGGESCGAPSHVGPSAGFNYFRLGTCSVARGRRLPCLSNVRRRGASVRRMGEHGTWAAYPCRGCSLPRSAFSNRARLAANSRHCSSVIKRRPASCGRAAGASMTRCFDGRRDGASLERKTLMKNFCHPLVSRSGEALR